MYPKCENRVEKVETQSLLSNEDSYTIFWAQNLYKW